MGCHFTIPAPSCKEQNNQEAEMTVLPDYFTCYSNKMPSKKHLHPLGKTDSPDWEVYSGITLPSSALIPSASWFAANCLRFSSDSCKFSRQAPFPRNTMIFSWPVDTIPSPTVISS